MSPKLGVLGPKYQYFVIHFRLSEGELLTDFHSIRSELVLIIYQTGHINILTVKYIMELSKLKHLQCYTNSFGIDFRRFESQPQSNQLSITFTPSIEIIFETLETVDFDKNLSHSIIETIFNRNFRNTFHHHNGSNKRQRNNKHVSKQYHNSNTRKQYHYRNTKKRHQHRNTSQQYQPRSFQMHKTYSIPYLKENCLG